MNWKEIDKLEPEHGPVIVAKRNAPKMHISIDMIHTGWYFAKISANRSPEVLKYIEAGFTHFCPMFSCPVEYD